MNREQARSTLLVRAVEQADRDGVLLPLAVRDRCTVEAGPPEAPAVGGGVGPEAEAFLARRAGLAESELARRQPGLQALGAGLGLGSLLPWAGALVVLAMGFMSALAWTGQPLRLLGFPLLWLILWNLVAYLWLLVMTVAGGRHALPQPLVDLVSRLLARLRLPRWPAGAGSDAGAATAARAAGQFLREWLPLQGPLLAARARALLHAGALLLTLGAVTGLAAFGTGLVHYRVAWESSWGVTAEGLHALLRWVLAPAAWVTPESIAVMPTLEDVRSWSLHEGGQAGDARDLVQLFMVAAILYVAIPRAMLWAWARHRAGRLGKSFYSPPADDRYYRRLLQAGRGAGEVAAVFFHGIEPTTGLRTRVREALADELGGRVTLEFMPPVAYGEEAGTATALAGHDERERVVAVFSLAATPEQEVQGELLRQLAALAPAGGDSSPLVVLDATPLERFESDGGFRAHYEERLRAWERFVKGEGVPRTIVVGRAAAARSGGAP